MGNLNHHDFTERDPRCEEWTRALAKLRKADADFAPVRADFDRAERAYFALRATEKDGARSDSDLAAVYAEIGLEDATERERQFGNAVHEAAEAFFRTPAPHLAALVEKVELIETIGFDGSVEALILADLRRLVGGPS